MTTNHPDAVTQGAHAGVPSARPIHVPDDWDDQDLLTFEQFCALIHTPARTVRDWRRRTVGPTWHKYPGTGRLYITVAETRRFLTPTQPTINNGQNQETAR